MTQQAYSIREAAALLDLHPETLRRAVRRGELTVARIGGRILRVSAIELERWWQANGGGQLFAEPPAADGTTEQGRESGTEQQTESGAAGASKSARGAGRTSRRSGTAGEPAPGPEEETSPQRSLFDGG